MKEVESANDLAGKVVENERTKQEAAEAQKAKGQEAFMKQLDGAQWRMDPLDPSWENIFYIEVRGNQVYLGSIWEYMSPEEVRMNRHGPGSVDWVNSAALDGKEFTVEHRGVNGVYQYDGTISEDGKTISVRGLFTSQIATFNRVRLKRFSLLR